MYFFRSKINFWEHYSAGHFAIAGCFRILPVVFFLKLLAQCAFTHSVFCPIVKPVLHLFGQFPFRLNDFPLFIIDLAL